MNSTLKILVLPSSRQQNINLLSSPKMHGFCVGKEAYWLCLPAIPRGILAGVASFFPSKNEAT